jgi:hypothetical protein
VIDLVRADARVLVRERAERQTDKRTTYLLAFYPYVLYTGKSSTLGFRLLLRDFEIKESHDDTRDLHTITTGKPSHWYRPS